MSRVFVRGCGAVSAAGWGMEPLRQAMAQGQPLPTRALPRPGWDAPLLVRPVPAPEAPLKFLAHPRLRRTSPIAHYVLAAGLEALGADAVAVGQGSKRLGIVFCTMSGCVNYSRRFYDETLRDPGSASPLVFPETVFNSPASHLAALLGTPAMNYTLVGDPGIFLNGVVLAAQWLEAGQVDSCLVIAAEESDWLTADAFRLFSREVVLGAGAGALYLSGQADAAASVELSLVTDAHLLVAGQKRADVAAQMRAQLPGNSGTDLLVDGLQDAPRWDAGEATAWRGWPGARLSPKRIVGEGLMAASAWQCALAVDALKQSVGHATASVSIVGCNQQAIGAQFVKVADPF